MAMYKCIPAVKKKCGVDCEGTYNGTDCECAKINMAYLPPTVRNELAAYHATGLTPEEIPQMQAERDAAIRDIEQIMTDLDVCHGICVYCEYDKDCEGACSPKWRGLGAKNES